VTGTATLTGGTLQPSLLGGFVPAVGSTVNNVITAAGGVVGTFDSVGHAAPVLRAVPDYVTDPNAVSLTFERHLTNPELGLDGAQLGLALALTGLEQTNPSANLTEILDAITNLPTAEEVKNAYDQILPRKLDQMAQSTMTGARMQNGNLLTRMNNLRHGVTPRGLGFVQNDRGVSWNYDGLLLAESGSSFSALRNLDRLEYDKDTAKRWGVFANGSGVFGDQDSRQNQTGYDFTAASGTIGVDYRVIDELVIGLAGGYNHIDTSVDNNGGDATVQSASIAPYVSYSHESIYFDATAGYARNFYDIDRNIAFGTINTTANGNPEGNQAYAYADVGYDYKIKDFVIGPVGTISYTRLWIDSYTESGAGVLNLDIGSQTADSLQSGIGWQWAYIYQKGDFALVPNMTVTWQHEYLDDSRFIEAKFAGGGGSFQTPTADAQRDTALIRTGVNARLSDCVTLTLGHSMILGDSSYSEQAVNGGVRFDF
jgi:outer membrane autotransporter protein